jgi:hypothetical protein
VLDLSNLEGANFANMSSGSIKYKKENTKIVTNIGNESKGNVETTGKKTTPILDLSQNSIEKSLLEKTDVLNTSSSSDKSGEDSNSNSNKILTNPEPEIKDTIDPIDKEVMPQLELNQINTEGTLLNGNNTVMDTLTQHSKPASVRTLNRKKQSPLTKNEDFLWK